MSDLFDPSRFIAAEKAAALAAEPPREEERSRNVARTLLQSSPAQVIEKPAVRAEQKRGVATVATVAALPAMKPHSLRLNRLFEQPRPPAWGERRWRQLLEDARAFVASDMARDAMDAGWSDLELFGCPALPVRDKALPSSLGVVFMLRGSTVVEAQPDFIAIEVRLGRGGSHRSRFQHDHFMTARSRCLPMWDAFDLNRWPDEAFGEPPIP